MRMFAENVALGKPASQIGDWDPNTMKAENAVDGNRDPDISNGHCAHPGKTIYTLYSMIGFQFRESKTLQIFHPTS